MSLGKNDVFISSFPIYIPFISSSWLIALARTSITMLKRSSERKHPSLVLDLRGKNLSFLPLTMMSGVGFF